MNKRKLLQALIASCCILGAPTLYAQQDQPAGEDDVDFVLSPFEVDARGDLGYRATTTLAGTRIRTDLRDIGAAISIVTEQFLEDTGSVNIEDLLVYTTNTEVGGLGGNFSASQGFGAGLIIPELQRDSNQGGLTRVRGLAQADLTRNFFLTEIPFDAYNTNRITIQRGANAALFGLGSPGGIVDNNLIQADFLGDRGRVRLKTDEHGTLRSELRAYNELIDNTWSLLVAGLYERKQFEQKQAWEKDRRAYLSTLWEPVENLRVRFNIEYGDRNGARPRTEPPNDLLTPFYLMGKPTFSHPIEAGEFRNSSGDLLPGVNNNQIMTPLSMARQGPLYVYSDPSRAEADVVGAQAFLNANQQSFDDNERTMLGFRTIHDIINRTGMNPDGSPIPEGSRGFFARGFADRQITDRSIFDYRKNLLDGGSSQQFSKWRDASASVEKTWLDDQFGIELAAHQQRWHEGQLNQLRGGGQSIGINIDMNEFMGIATVDGTPSGEPIPNPNFGGAAIVARAENSDIQIDRDALRAIGFGEIHAEDFIGDELLASVLGRLNVTGLASQQDLWNRTLFTRDVADRQQIADRTRDGEFPGSGFHRPHSYHALEIRGLPEGQTLADLNSIDDLRGVSIQPIPFGRERHRIPRSGTFRMWNEAEERFEAVDIDTFTIHDNDSMPAAFSASKTRTKVESLVAIGQHYIWEDTLVLQGSWRRDKQYTHAGGNAPALAPYTSRRDLRASGWVFPDEPTSSAKGTTRSWGIVVHTPEFIKRELPLGSEISFHYSEASNFEPSAGRLDAQNRPLPQVTGSTEEMGFTVSTMNQQLIARVNWYETGVLNDSFQTSGFTAPQGIMLDLNRQLDNQDNIDQGFTADDVRAHLPPQGVIDVHGITFDFEDNEPSALPNPARVGTQDFVSDGVEIEISYFPTRNWHNQIVIGKQKTITDNTYPVLGQLLEDFFEPMWINSNFAQNFYIDEDSTQTLAERTTQQLLNDYLRAKGQDGTPTIEQREWTATASTSYRFRDQEGLPDWVRNFTVGGSIRWEDKQGIGFGLTQNEFGDWVRDVDQTFYGSPQTFYDVFARYAVDMRYNTRLTLQLNIKDLTNHDGLVPIFANTDGSRVYRIQEGRLASLTATLDF